jgi:Zn finger protein HypA/HybF involved in hydrogenase expression
MHEFGVTQSIIGGLLRQLERDKVTRVIRITFRRSSAFSEEALRQTYSVLSAHTPLEGAELVIEVAVLRVTCTCGYTGQVNSEDLFGHAFICPSCGAVREIAEAHDLELVEVLAETADDLDAVGP